MRKAVLKDRPILNVLTLRILSCVIWEFLVDWVRNLSVLFLDIVFKHSKSDGTRKILRVDEK